MTTQTVGYHPPSSELSERLAAEVRAEMARQQMSVRSLAAKMGISHGWLARRVSAMDVPINLDDLAVIAAALDKPLAHFLRWLPRLDSNQQPAG